MRKHGETVLNDLYNAWETNVCARCREIYSFYLWDSVDNKSYCTKCFCYLNNLDDRDSRMVATEVGSNVEKQGLISILESDGIKMDDSSGLRNGIKCRWVVFQGGRVWLCGNADDIHGPLLSVDNFVDHIRL